MDIKIENDYHIAVFGNGLRAVASRAAGQVSYIGLLVNAGSRDESPEHPGLAHFVEHTIFKGTRRRSSWHISNRMESVGGELNAYTTKEETMIYTNAPAGNTDRALDLIADLVTNATFPTAEIEREREVIIEEINSYLDSPMDSVFDEYEELAYKGGDLAHNILGTPESVRQMTGSDARAFIDRNYRPEDMVLYIVDSGDPQRNLQRAERYFGSYSARSSEPRRPRIPTPQSPLFHETRDRGNHQANVIVGARVFGRTDPRRHALFLLNNYLAGPCMNSRLNQELRDRRGLVYTVDSNVALMSDAGLLTIYYGTDPKAVDKCEKLIRRELEKLAETRLSERKFAAVRNQYCGQLTVGSDHRESRAMALAKSLMYYGAVHDIRHTAELVKQLTAEDMRQAAELVLASGLSRLSLC